MCICPQQLWPGGTTTSCPSRSRSVAVARATCGVRVSTRQVANSAIFTTPSSSPCGLRATDHARLPDDELGLEQQLLVPVVGIARLVEEQLRRTAAQLVARLAGRREGGGRRPPRRRG